MGLMDFLKPADINAGVEEFRATPGACTKSRSRGWAVWPFTADSCVRF